MRHPSLATCLLLLLGCDVHVPAVPSHTVPPGGSHFVTSNVLRKDYVGSNECADCHPAETRAWEGSPMHRMTRLIAQAELRAPFDGETFGYKGDQATAETRDGERFMHVLSKLDGEHTYRITKVIGGRTREDFVGVDVDAPSSEEVVLPISWVYATQSWRVKGYSVMLRERPALTAGPVWRKTCIFCHNTAPYLSTVFDDLIAPGTRGYQGSVTDYILPRDKLWRVRARDEAGLAHAVVDEIKFLTGSAPSAEAVPLRRLLADAMSATEKHFGEHQLIEVGIGCEACHFGARAHTEDPQIKPAYGPRSSLLSLDTPDGKEPTRAQNINHICAHCHTVLFSKYPFTWEGGHRESYETAGGSSITSGEARDFQLGGCASQMACTTCHDPHSGALRPPTNATCTACHAQYDSEDALAAHTHHNPDSEGSKCLGCHMPRKNLGLSYNLTRYHRIGSPTDVDRVERDRPLECAVCHANESVGEIVDQMERWWGRRYDRAALRRLYGDDLSVNVLAATLARGLPHEQAVAIGIAGESKVAFAAPLLVPMLAHPYPLLRYLARHSLESIIGRPLNLDLDQDEQDILEQAASWLRAQPLPARSHSLGSLRIQDRLRGASGLQPISHYSE